MVNTTKPLASIAVTTTHCQPVYRDPKSSDSLGTLVGRRIDEIHDDVKHSGGETSLDQLVVSFPK